MSESSAACPHCGGTHSPEGCITYYPRIAWPVQMTPRHVQTVTDYMPRVIELLMDIRGLLLEIKNK